MKNMWSHRAFTREVSALGRKGVDRHLANCIYGSRLLGANQSLVFHGGGNSSVKTKTLDITGKVIATILVKASGHDLRNIGPSGFAELDFAMLADLEHLEDLSDKEMFDKLERSKLDPNSPRPSVETLIHVFVPKTYIFHTHANSVLSLTNQPNGLKLSKEVFDADTITLPYSMSGFALAKKASLALQEAPDSRALIVLKHGLFTFGDSAREAYDNMIKIVSLAEGAITARRKPFPIAARIKKSPIISDKVAPILRGAILSSKCLNHGIILDFRNSASIKRFVKGKSFPAYANRGPVTPDHVIWTKPRPLILLSDLTAGTIRHRLENYKRSYARYFKINNSRLEEPKLMKDPLPRVVFVQDLGLFGVGATAKHASIAADLAEVSIEVIETAERIGKFSPASTKDIFDIEYWPLEYAKAKLPTPLPLLGRVALVTGGGSGIGAAAAEKFKNAGAEVAILDINAKQVKRTSDDLNCVGIVVDVRDPVEVRKAFRKVVMTFGGIDIVISNAGAAWEGEVGTVSNEVLRKSFEINFFAHQIVAQNAVKVMKEQNMGGSTGGSILFNTSKQAVNPGKNFGPYGLPKAATLFLVRQYALDHGKDGIRTGGVNADRVRTRLLDNTTIANRAKARGVSKSKYLTGNLLGREVLAEDVAKAFLDLALSPSTTGAILTVDGGNIEAALR